MFVLDRLEVAFWQQHPQLQQMSGFMIEYLQKAGLARLRGSVADAVVSTDGDAYDYHCVWL